MAAKLESVPEQDKKTIMLFGSSAKTLLTKNFFLGEMKNPDELVAQKGIEVFDRMMCDDVVGPGTDMRKLLLLAFQMKYNAGIDGDLESEKRRDETKWNLEEGMSRPFYDCLEDVADAPNYGFSFSEIRCKINSSGPYLGGVGLKDLQGIPPASILFKPDEFGSLQGENAVKQKDNPQKLNINKFVHLVYNQRYANPYGNSILRRSYPSWWSKDVSLHFWTKHLETWSSPLVDIEIPPEIGSDDQAKQEIARVMYSLQNDTRFYHDARIKVNVLKGTPAAGYGEAINYFNKAIMRSLLIPDLAGFTEMNAGSYALGKGQLALLFMFVRVERQKLLDALNFQLIPPLEDANYKKGEKYSWLSVEKESLQDITDILLSFTSAFAIGAFNPANLEDLNNVRAKMGLTPIKPEEAENYLTSIAAYKKSVAPSQAGAMFSAREVQGKRDEFADLISDIAENTTKHIEAIHEAPVEFAGDTPTTAIARQDIASFEGKRGQILDGLDKFSDEALAMALNAWKEGDIAMLSKVAEEAGNGDLGKRVRDVYKSAYTKGVQSSEATTKAIRAAKVKKPKVQK